MISGPVVFINTEFVEMLGTPAVGTAIGRPSAGEGVPLVGTAKPAKNVSQRYIKP